ncbi:MAG: hypothetical protein ACLQJR_21595 [Stellaceae bacterium]
MTEHYHAVVWIDHHQARIIYFNLDAAEEHTLHPPHPPRHLHSKAGSASGTHIAGEPAFYREVAEALAPAHAVLIAGPAGAKLELVDHLRQHAPQMIARISGVETMGEVTDAQLVAAARRHFKAADRMTPQVR